MFNAIKGFPPIAKTSLREFAAAISPHFSGSSTIGVTKSTVSIPALFSSIVHIAASSPDAQLAINLSCEARGMFFNVCARSAGPILAAQPLVLDISVNLIKGTSIYSIKIIT